MAKAKVKRYQPPKGVEPETSGEGAGDPAPLSDIYRLSSGLQSLSFISSGCTLLDCATGGGWPLGRVVNIVGDRSTGKTLLAEEAMANFLIQYPNGRIWYRETEAAFDESYARGLGLDTSKIDFGPDGADSSWDTIESLFDDLNRILDENDARIAARAKALREANKKLTAPEALKLAMGAAVPGLYIIDSLDAVSSETELDRDVHEGSYNLAKQKLMGELFRRLVRRVKRAGICIVFISQIRDRIGAMIKGKKYTRTGGKALDFYASIVLYLADLGKVYETKGGIKRAVAIKIKARCEKNKITAPFRECVFELRFGYGIDDEYANFEWLKENKRLEEAGYDKIPLSIKGVDGAKLRRDTIRIWNDIESSFMPAKGKYA